MAAVHLLYKYRVTGKLYIMPESRHPEFLQHTIQLIQGFLIDVETQGSRRPLHHMKAHIRNMILSCVC